MAYDFYLEHQGRDGTVKNKVVFPRNASWFNSVDSDESLFFSIESGNVTADDYEEYDIIIAYLRNLELGIKIGDSGFVPVFVGILRDEEVNTDDDGITVTTYDCPEQKHLLRLREVCWAAGTDDRTKFKDVPAETVMKTLVRYNLTADATIANGRKDEGDLASGMGFTINIAPDQGRGDLITDSFTGENVLEALQDLRSIGGGDFSLTYQGNASWLFEFHPGQLGEDKSTGSDRVVFSIDRPYSNMRNPRLKIKRKKSATRAVVAGQSKGKDRIFEPAVTGTGYATDNDVEIFVDARDEEDPDALTSRGLRRLDEVRPIEVFDFTVLQTANIFYSPVAVAGRKTYDVGDKVLATYRGDRVRIIKGIGVQVAHQDSQDAVQIFVDTEDSV